MSQESDKDLGRKPQGEIDDAQLDEVSGGRIEGNPPHRRRPFGADQEGRMRPDPGSGGIAPSRD